MGRIIMLILVVVLLIALAAGTYCSSPSGVRVVELPREAGHPTASVETANAVTPLAELASTAPLTAGTKPTEEVRQPAVHPLESEVDWARQFAKSSLKTLREEKQLMLDRYKELSRPEFQKRIANGQFEIVSNDGKYTPTGSDPLELSLVEMLPKSKGGEVRKTVLPAEDFPELRNMKAKIVWLDTQIHKEGN